MNTGRYGPSAVRSPIHAPPTPSANSTSGATQHSEAPIAANIAATNERPAVNAAIALSFLSQPRTRRIDPVPKYGVKGKPMNGLITIGHLAEAAGVNVETIRYYQRRGLLEEPSKPPGGQRRYSADAARRVRFIKRAQLLGFTLAEVEALLRLEDGQSCRKTRLLARQKLKVIEQRIADLARMRRLLGGLVAECQSGRRPRSCPIIATLSADGRREPRRQERHAGHVGETSMCATRSMP